MWCVVAVGCVVGVCEVPWAPPPVQRPHSSLRVPPAALAAGEPPNRAAAATSFSPAAAPTHVGA